MAAAELHCPWPECDFKTPHLEGTVGIQLLQMHQQAVHSRAALAPDRHPRAKLPHLEVTEDGAVTETSLGIFRQQLASYRRSLGSSAPSDALPDTVLQALPPAAYSLMYARYGETLSSQTEQEVLHNMEALMVRPEN